MKLVKSYAKPLTGLFAILEELQKGSFGGFELVFRIVCGQLVGRVFKKNSLNIISEPFENNLKAPKRAK